MNKNIFIFGNGNLLKYVQDDVSQTLEFDSLEVCNNIELANKIDIKNTDFLFLAVSWHETKTWVEILKQAGAKIIYRVPVYVMQYGLSIFDSNGNIEKHIVRIDTDKTDLLYIETHLADTCNLKCKGCMHFSNLAVNPNFPDIRKFKRDFLRLKELFSNIYIIRLMGGEPLLNPQIDKYVDIVREIFPAAEIRIVTNGLLIPRQKPELWECIRNNYVGMDISPYPPTIEMIDEIKGILDREKIPYGTIAEKLQKFRKSLTLHNNNDPQQAVKICQSSHCHFLRDGLIAKCPLPLLIGDFNKEYGYNIESKSFYNIYEEKSGQDLKDKLESYADMCRYCPDKEAFIDWERTYNNASIKDWVVEA